jgi:hypothetical protein
MEVKTEVEKAVEFLRGLNLKSYEYKEMNKVIKLLIEQEVCIDGYEHGSI